MKRSRFTVNALLVLVCISWGLCGNDLAQATPLITEVFATGTNLAPEGVHFTGETFDHSIEGAGFTVLPLDEDVPSFTDRNHEYNGYSTEVTIASLGLVGAEYVMAPNDDRGVADYQLDITVSQTVDAFVFMDTRVPQPAWLTDNGWTFLGHRLGIDEGGDGVGSGEEIENTFWIWQQSNVAAGTLTTYERGGTGNNMYGVAVMVPGGGPGIKEFTGAEFTPANFGLIDIGATGGQFEPGALADGRGIQQIGAAVHNTNNTNLVPREMTSALDPDGFSLEINNLDIYDTPVGGLDWRDRGDSAAAIYMDLPLLRMGEDFVKNNAGIIRVVLGGLPAGDYNITSYHLDPDYSQCEGFDVYVDNGDGSGFIWIADALGDASYPNGDDDAPHAGGLEPQMLLDKSLTYQVTADGIHDIMILFDGTLAFDTELPFNGLNIELIGAVVPNADFDGDGDVDGADFLIWQQNYGTPSGASLQDGDANSDGAVTAADLAVWKGQHGTVASVGGLLTSTAVPEPASVWLLLFAFGGLCMWRRR